MASVVTKECNTVCMEIFALHNFREPHQNQISAIIFLRMPENWQFLCFGEARATLVDYTMTRELNTLLEAAVLTSSVFCDIKFSRMPTDSQNSRKLRNANVSAHMVIAVIVYSDSCTMLS